MNFFKKISENIGTLWCTINLPFTRNVLEITPLFILELFLTLLAFSIIINTVRQKRYAWLLNIFKKTIGLPIYFFKGLYVKCTLDIILILKSFYGWYRWGIKSSKKEVNELEVTILTPKEFISYILLSIVSSAILGFTYQKLGAALAYLDAWHAVMSIINYFLLVRKKREAWIFSLIGQLVYIYVCYTKGMVFLLKYILYVIFSLNALYKWHKIYKKNKPKTPNH